MAARVVVNYNMFEGDLEKYFMHKVGYLLIPDYVAEKELQYITINKRYWIKIGDIIHLSSHLSDVSIITPLEVTEWKR